MHPQFEELNPKWFNRANVYTGSIGDFRYRFATDKKERILHAAVYTVYCYEAARDVQEQDFPWDEDGVSALKAWRMKRLLLKLMRIPGLYRRVPGIFARETPKLFGETAGFAARELQTTGGVWRIDMTKCPYHDACVHYGCPELCHCFCDSDDITYDGMHPKLYWHRTKTLGRGGDCCDFCLKIVGE